MPHEYTILKTSNTYTITHGSLAVTTPMGNPYNTNHPELAELLRNDIQKYGPDPRSGGAKSYVMLHAGYCDFGRQVPKKMIIDNIFIGYTPDWDVALAAFQEFDDLASDPFVEAPQFGFELGPEFYFGPPETRKSISSWLKTLSRRALISVQTIGGNLHSILVGYRLLQEQPGWPVESLAKGIMRFSNIVDIPPNLEDDMAGVERNFTEFLHKAKKYAAFPDD